MSDEYDLDNLTDEERMMLEFPTEAEEKCMLMCCLSCIVFPVVLAILLGISLILSLLGVIL